MNIWKRLTIEPNQAFIIKFETEEAESNVEELLSNKITCWLSDLKTLWCEHFENGTNMLKRVQTMNPLLFADSGGKSFLKTITSIPDDETFTKNCRIEKDEENLKLITKYYLADRIPLNFNWCLKKCNKDEFFEQITKQMLWQISTLEQDNNNLIDLIKRKDQEIEQYKLEGAGTLTRKRLITEPFQLCKDLVNVQLFDKDIIGLNSGFVTPPPVPQRKAQVSAENEKTENPNEAGVSESEQKGKPPRARNWRKQHKMHPVYKPTPKVTYEDTSDSELSQEVFTVDSLPNRTHSENVAKRTATSTTTEERPKKITKKLNL